MRKLTLFLCSAPGGLATGLLAWFVAGGAQAGLDKVASVEDAVAGLRTPRPAVAIEGYASVADLVAAPLFGTATGAAPDPAIRLDGVSLSRQRTAALLSIGGAAAEWLKPGESRGEVILQQVGAARVLVETPSGTKEIALGQVLGGAPVGPSPGAVPGLVAPNPGETPPPGYRGPPPPASAPAR